MAKDGKIKTTGQLRDFLVTMMVGVKDGVVAIEKASAITKIAGQVNESIYAEIKQARLQIDVAGDKVALGKLKIGAFDAA